MIDPHPDCTRCNGTGIATEQHDFCAETGPCACVYRDECEPCEEAAPEEPKAPDVGRSFFVAIIVDRAGTTQGTAAQEVEQHKQKFTRLLAPNPVEFYAPNFVEGLQPGTDLVVYDFGGLGRGAGDYLMQEQARELLNWSQEHPSALIVLVSVFTFQQFLKPEMTKLGLSSSPSIVLDDRWDDESPIPAWFFDQAAKEGGGKP